MSVLRLFPGELADPGIKTKPRELIASQSRPADIFTTAAVPARSAALDVCVASSIAAAARGDAAQAAFDRKLTHHRDEFGALVLTEHSLPLACVDCRRAAASSRHPGASVRSRHRFQSEWAAFVGEVPSSQMEARTPNRSPAEEGSHGSRGSPKPLCKGRSGSSQASLTEPCITWDMSQPLTGTWGART